MSINKITNSIFCLSIIILLFYLEGCSSNISKDSKLNLRIELKNGYAWLNFMPGENLTFHFKGSLDITNTGNDTVRNLELKEIDIFRDSELIYKLNSAFLNTENNGGFNIPPQAKKLFAFRLPAGIKIIKEIRDASLIDARFIFLAEGNELEYEVKNIKVNKVY